MKRLEWLKPLAILRLGLSLLIVGQGIPARELLASSPVTAVISVRVVSPISGNPTAITSISAVPDFSVPEKAGGVVLSWSAPTAADGSPVYSYAIKYATFPASGLGSADSWWNNPNTITALQTGTPTALGWLAQATPGNTETVNITGLTPAVYYYFGIRARDKYFNISDYDSGLSSLSNQAQTYAATYPLTPTKVTSLVAKTTAQAGSVNLSWTTPQFFDPSTSKFVSGKIYYPGEYCVQYSTMMPSDTVNPPNLGNNWDSSTQLFISTSNIQTNDYQAVGITGLMLPTTYYFLTFIRNEWPTHWSAIATNYAAVQPFSVLKPVTGLGAVADASADVSTGSYVSLKWTNPTGENNLAGVRVCYSTVTTPSTPVSAQFIDLQPETSGQVALYQHVQLIPRTTYYYTVYAFNSGQTYYSVGTSTQVYVGKDILAPDTVNNVTALAYSNNSGPSDIYYINLAWTSPSATPYYRNADYSGVNIYFSTYTQVSSAQTYLGTITGTNSQAEVFTQNNLAAFATYYYSIFSYDSSGNVSTTPLTTSAYVSGSLVTPSAPQVLTMLVNANPDPAVGCSVYLQWTTPPEANVTGTRVVYRTDRYPASASDGTAWVDKHAAPSSTYNLTANQLSPSTTYYVTLFAYTGYGTYSRSAVISGFTYIPWSDNVAPMAPLGLQTARASASTVVVSWSPVRYNADRTKFSNASAPTIMELYSYEVYRSTAIFGDWQVVAVNNASTMKYTDTIPVVTGKYYYMVRSKDASGNYSDSNIIDVDGYVHILCSDSSSLSLKANKLQDNMILPLTRDTGDEKGPIIKSLEWEPYKIVETTSSYTLAKLSLSNFTSYDVSSSTVDLSCLSISYMTGTGSGAQAAPALRTMSEADIEKDVSVFYYNGVEWLKIASSIDTDNKVIKAKSMFAGKYQLRKSPRATEFTFYSVMPRIITPNNDRQNDRVLFRYSNPKASSISIRIFDLRGALVKKLDDTNATSDIQGEYIYWDGTDQAGATVPVGVYIYQLDGEGKNVNGTIVVAR